MPTFEITSPDGAIYHVDGPDGATEEQAMQQVMSQHQQPQGFGARIGQDLQNRQQEGQQILKSDISGPSKVIQYVGKVGGGLANDAIGEATPEILKKISGGAVDLADKALQYAPGYQAYGKAVGNTVNAASGQWDNFSQAHPEIAGDISAVGEVGKLAGNLASIKGGADAVRGGLNAASDAMANLPAKISTPSVPVPKSKELFATGEKSYSAADAAGGGATHEAVNDFVSQASKNAAQNPQLMAAFGEDEGQKYLNSLSALQDQPMNLKTAQALDIDMRERASKAFRAGDNTLGRRYSDMRQALRDNIYNQTDPNKLTGGPEAFFHLQKGNQLYSQAFKVEEIENMVADAMTKDVPSTAIKNKFAKLAKEIRESGPGGRTPEQIQAIEMAGKTGALTGFMKGMGSKLGAVVGGGVGGTIGAGVGGPFGAALGGTVGSGVGYATGAPFRAAATALQMRKANNALRSVVK